MPSNPDDFGANQGFIEDLYAAFLEDPDKIGPQWQNMFRSWKKEGRVPIVPSPSHAEPDVPEPSEKTVAAQHAVYNKVDRSATSDANITRSDLPPQPRAAAVAPITPYAKKYQLRPTANWDNDETETTALRGADRALARNMDASLEIPTATTVRAVPARVMFDNRTVINNYLASTRGGKISFTHLIAYALVEALAEMPQMNCYYRKDDAGKPSLVQPAHVNLGIAIDVVKRDGSRTLVVPSIKECETLTFAEFVSAYQNLVKRGRNNELTMNDYQGTTASLTNPGGFGTTHSIPRLMNGQGVIVGVGTIDYPAQFKGSSDQTLAQLGVSKVVQLTSTYDHRAIQGATSGKFLALLEKKLLGLDGFYDRVYVSLRVPYSPIMWEKDVVYDAQRETGKPARIAQLVHAYRSRGHLIADTDPLSFHVRRHPDLELDSYGLTLWDLDRSFPTGGFGHTDTLTLREILSQLRSTYCRTVGIEYMHIQDPVQRKWFQDRLERPSVELSEAEHLRILKKLNQAEAFETFLQTKYVGQKRFSLEGGESLIPALDQILESAAECGLSEATIGMAHRGRLNVLTNIAGKSYKQVFSEFDGVVNRRSAGSGDVKYHLGTEGTYTSPEGDEISVYLAANPSHLEAASPVLQGVARAKQDALGIGNDSFAILPILVHGDAALAGQGVVAEVLNMSQLPGYRTGGTIHIVVNNQIGFTTSPSYARSSRYATDITKGMQLPIFHVNGDDPEAVCRVAKLAFSYRTEFHKDVIIDITCYRRRGHNEGDDPSMTQPIMYSLIEGKPSPRQHYQDSLLGRGLLSAEQIDALEAEYHQTLSNAFHEVRAAEQAAEQSETEAAQILGLPAAQQEDAGTMVGWQSAVPLEVIARIGDAHQNVPEGFTLHRKIAKLFDTRTNMAHIGDIDWSFAELLAFGSLLIEGVPVRLAGQDSRRGTFSQRHATAHCFRTGAEWTPLRALTADQAPIRVYDSPLSEFAALGFEYGYSVERPDALVLWEAQFGDFANGAQTVIDEFVTSAEQKWNQRSSLVMLLPHGHEGQGPDHSSARMERYLQMCAEDNLLVTQPSTPANYFHLLRQQAYLRPRRPLIVFTPKQLLRRREVVSSLANFTAGEFRPVIGEETARSGVRRVLLCSGRVYYDLAAQREKLSAEDVAILRLEQLYPEPQAELLAELDKYPDAEVVWVQDEPQNQGAWSHLALNLFPLLNRPVRFVGRSAAASTASGLVPIYQKQEAELLSLAFAR